MAELYDIVAANQRATQVGTQLGSVMANNSLRMQELQSKRALEQLQQQQAAETLAWTLRQHKMAIQEDAKNAARTADFMAMQSPTITLPGQPEPQDEDMAPMIGPDGQPEIRTPGMRPMIMPDQTVPNPHYVADPGEAYIKAFMRDSIDPAKTVMTGAKLSQEYTQAQWQQARANQALTQTGPGSIEKLTAPDGGEFQVLVPPPGRGAVQLVGAANPEIVTQGGRQFVRGKDGALKPLAQDQMARMTANALHKQAEAAPDLSVPNPDAPGLRMVDPNKFDEYSKRQALPTGTRAALEKSFLSTQEALATADRALKTINDHPEAIGVLGAGRGAAERVKGQLGIETDTEVSKARHQLALDFTQLANGLKVDSGNMSRYERNKLELVGDPTRWEESHQTAGDMMFNIKAALVGKQLRNIRESGRKADDALLNSIPSSELGGLASDHLISPEDAVRWYELRNKR